MTIQTQIESLPLAPRQKDILSYIARHSIPGRGCWANGFGLSNAIDGEKAKKPGFRARLAEEVLAGLVARGLLVVMEASPAASQWIPTTAKRYTLALPGSP